MFRGGKKGEKNTKHKTEDGRDIEGKKKKSRKFLKNKNKG